MSPLGGFGPARRGLGRTLYFFWPRPLDFGRTRCPTNQAGEGRDHVLEEASSGFRSVPPHCCTWVCAQLSGTAAISGCLWRCGRVGEESGDGDLLPVCEHLRCARGLGNLHVAGRMRGHRRRSRRDLGSAPRTAPARAVIRPAGRDAFPPGGAAPPRGATAAPNGAAPARDGGTAAPNRAMAAQNGAGLPPAADATAPIGAATARNGGRAPRFGACVPRRRGEQTVEHRQRVRTVVPAPPAGDAFVDRENQECVPGTSARRLPQRGSVSPTRGGSCPSRGDLPPKSASH